MSYLTLPTRQLVGLLADVVLTASTDPETPEISCVLLHTTRSEHPDDGGLTDVLVATATDAIAVGQASAECSDQLHRPVVVSVTDAKSIVGVFKKLVGKFGREVTHLSEVELSGEVLTVREDRKQSPDGTSMSVFVQNADRFPAFVNAMCPDMSYPKDGQGLVVEPSYGTAYASTRLAAFATVGKRRGEPVWIYRHHQSRTVVVTVGSWYRGAIRPAGTLDEEQYNEPLVPVFTLPANDEAKGAA